MDSFAGKTAVVTGGGSGLGRAMVLAFAARGMNTVLADVDMAAAESVAEECRALGVKALALPCNVTDRASVKAVADRAFAEFGGVHVLCNNAGVVTFKPTADLTDSDWDWVMGVDLDGVINGLLAFLPRIVAQGEGGHIVNTSSSAGLYPHQGIIAYSAAKYGVMALSEELRMALEQFGIGVSVLCPGLVPTRIHESARNRPAELGGPETPSRGAEAVGASMAASPITAAVVGQLVAQAIADNQLYIVTHASTRAGVEARREALREAYASV